MSNHYTWCDPTRCDPPVHRSPVVGLPTHGGWVGTFLRHMDGSPFGTAVVVDAPQGFSATLDTLKRWVAELNALTQPRVGAP